MEKRNKTKDGCRREETGETGVGIRGKVGRPLRKNLVSFVCSLHRTPLGSKMIIRPFHLPFKELVFYFESWSFFTPTKSHESEWSKQSLSFFSVSARSWRQIYSKINIHT